MNNDEKNYQKSYEEAFSDSFKQGQEEFDSLVKGKLVLSLLGDVNVGKSNTINALTGRKLADVKAIAGWTKEISLHRFSENVYIADTPGLKDINQEVSKKSSEFIEKDSDIILLFFNAAVGPEINILNTYKEIKKLNKPIILVLNKIDIWYKNGVLAKVDDYNDVIGQIKHLTGQEVIPISAEEHINIDILSNEIVKVLEGQGKDLFFLKISKYKEEKVSNWINGASISAFGIGIIPLPGADIIPLTSLQVGLALKIAYIYNCKVTKDDVMALIGSTITGGVGKQLFRWGLEGLKALGWVGGPIGEGAASALAGTIAAAITYGFGWASNEYYKSGMQIDLGQLSEIYNKMYEEKMKKLKSK